MAIRFRPTVGGARSAELVVTPATGDPLSVDLTGTGHVTASVSAASPVREGNGEAERSIEFTVSLTAASTESIDLSFETIEGTASPDEDYEQTEGALSIRPGAREAVVSVPLIDDELDESAETFSFLLSDHAAAEIEGGRMEAVILDDDAPPLISVASLELTESDEEATKVIFIVRLTAPSGRAVSVQYTTEKGTATAGVDYGPTEGRVTWEPGETETSIPVEVFGDSTFEANEKFSIRLSNPSNAAFPGTESVAEGVGTIINNDSPPSVAISDVKLVEGNPPASVQAVFQIALSMVSGLDVTVHAITADGPSERCFNGPEQAVSGSDYVHTDRLITIPPGKSGEALGVSIIADNSTECLSEQFLVTLSQPKNARIEDGQAVGTILDDDPVP